MILRAAARDLGVDQGTLEGTVRAAAHLYKFYVIPKRGPAGGEREIRHPSPRLKVLQRWLVKSCFARLPLSSAATAYHRGATIRSNAAPHARHRFLLRIDFSNFFPSLRAPDVAELISANRDKLPLVENQDDVAVVLRTVCYGGALPVGAPSSPAISNAIMYPFDEAWLGTADRMGCTYTRYADDLYFSTDRPNVLAEVLELLRQHLAEMASPRLAINNSKLLFTSRKRRRVVTGLVLTPEGTLSVGRDQKRYVRGLMHRWRAGALDPKQRAFLTGYLAHVQSVEPEFLDRLARKYGARLVAEISGLDVEAVPPF